MSKANVAVKPIEAPEVEVQAPKTEKKVFKLTAVQEKAMAKLKGPSKQVRYLLSEGLTRSQICKVATNSRGEPILYQHVRGIEVAMLAKQAEAKAAATTKGGKK